MKNPARIIDYSLKIFKAEWPNLVLWSFLLSPLIVRTLANYQYSKIDLLVVYTLGMSVLWLLAIRFVSSSQFKVHIILLPFYLVAAIDLFLVLNFNSRLTAAYIFIGLTNYQEASEFLPTYWQPISIVLVVFILCYGAGLIGLHKRELYKNKGIFVLVVSALLVGYGAYFYKTVKLNSFGKSAVMDLLAKDQSTPVGYLSQIALTANLYLGTENLIKRRRESDVKITSMSDQSNIETIVFVIGESSRPQNWSLYGYNKETTPNLGKQAGLFKFNQICTTAPYTSFAVPSMLSLEPISDWDAIASTKSLVSIYRAAGYMTYWLSVQEVDSFGGIIPQIAAEAQYRQYFERSYDGALISEYEEILNKSDTQKKAIFIHVKGSHFEYSRRYPENFDKFKPSTDNFKDKITAEYDNSILYTDWLLSTIIDRLKSSKKPSVLFYSSDHGENMMDDSRGLLGHGIGNKYDLPVSAFIWASDNVSNPQSLKLLKLKARESQKISISSLSHTLLNITGVFTSRYKSSEDLLSDDFVSSKCPHLLGAGYVPSFDFDAL
ncbi:sulfatase [Pseudomonas sp. GM41(2012)]|jgi:heptose-I-phosphate ethanolaminephosphotransferase|uniref:phosphoethanolamine transferase n=1 Tax=Pseudomonas sp. (strain GM41(2012)) TaxID=1144708 RepID=UPI0002705467|nr:phosphoethanolamine transferase [Pseudomonas sp. GM41(2012)]EUB75410.1 sulfatase [Pseudomonas sp. GM41(2012)]